MSASHRPQLRPYLGVARVDPREFAGRPFVLHDRLRLSPEPLPLHLVEIETLRLFDGTRTLLDVQMEVIRRLGGQIVPLELFSSLADRLDRYLYLESPRYQEAIGARVRPPSCLGVYSPDPREFREQMAHLFEHPQGAGRPGKPGSDSRVRAVLAPHIDYHRGGLAYTYAFKELFESTPASLFVIIGTSHYCGWRRFTLSRRDFQTPLGIVPTDQAYIDRLVHEYGGDLFEDEPIAHLPEHSIELEVLFLHYLYDRRRDIRIVPLVVGSFEDCVRTGTSPLAHEEVQRMIQALRVTEKATPEPVCYVISGDLAHIGPKFGASYPLDEPQLKHSRAQDERLLHALSQVDHHQYFQTICEEEDERNICGLPPTWITLEVIQAQAAKMLRYDQYVEEGRGIESVSFASAAFYR
ncbi:MAG: AmmeMemoRadiSam system protein B [Gemmataceae bacterium]